MSIHHCPGPWRIWKCMDTRQPRLIVDQNSDPICEIDEANTQSNGNARLLAAAPELLEALEAVYEAMRHVPEFGQPYKLASGWTISPIGQTMFAIAKARGTNQ